MVLKTTGFPLGAFYSWEHAQPNSLNIVPYPQIAHVGDSRIYKFTRQEGVVQLTVDHEVGQREIQRGVEPEVAYARPDAFQLTQALGPRDNKLVHPDVDFLELNKDTLLLLCTDGLSDNNMM